MGCHQKVAEANSPAADQRRDHRPSAAHQPRFGVKPHLVTKPRLELRNRQPHASTTHNPPKIHSACVGRFPTVHRIRIRSSPKQKKIVRATKPVIYSVSAGKLWGANPRRGSAVAINWGQLRYRVGFTLELRRASGPLFFSGSSDHNLPLGEAGDSGKLHRCLCKTEKVLEKRDGDARRRPIEIRIFGHGGWRAQLRGAPVELTGGDEC